MAHLLPRIFRRRILLLSRCSRALVVSPNQRQAPIPSLLENHVRDYSVTNRGSRSALSPVVATLCCHWLISESPGFSQQSRGYAKNAKKGKESKSKNKTKPKVDLSPEELSEVINVGEMKHKMEMSIVHLKKEFVEQLSLRTSVGVLDDLIVGTPDGEFPLIQLGQVVQKNPQLIVIDMTGLPQYTSAVKSAIMESGMNLNPQQDGTTLFVPVPKVTREYRETLAKNAKTLCDKIKDTLRHIQNNYVKELQKAQRSNDVSETLIQNLDEHVHFATKEFSAQADAMLKQKQHELLNPK